MVLQYHPPNTPFSLKTPKENKRRKEENIKEKKVRLKRQSWLVLN